MNGYPARIVNQRQPSRQMTPPDTEPLRATVVIPYIRNLSESIRSVLIPLRIRTYFKPHQTLSQILVHPKDPVPPDQRKGVVYKIPCSDCGMTYVGQTGRTLKVRKKEHMRALTNSDAMTSALAEHAMDTMHKIAWEDAVVLASDPYPHQRCQLLYSIFQWGFN